MGRQRGVNDSRRGLARLRGGQGTWATKRTGEVWWAKCVPPPLTPFAPLLLLHSITQGPPGMHAIQGNTCRHTSNAAQHASNPPLASPLLHPIMHQANMHYHAMQAAALQLQQARISPFPLFAPLLLFHAIMQGAPGTCAIPGNTRRHTSTAVRMESCPGPPTA